MSFGTNITGVKLPPDFDLQGQNAATEWKFWKTEFEDYLVATGQHDTADKVKISILRNIMGPEAARIMSTFKVPEEQTDNYEFMINMIEKYVKPRINECFERYNFLKRMQKEGESFEHFLTECKHLVRSCNYNVEDPNENAEDKAVRDKIVMGIRDTTTREGLLRIDQLTLEKAIQFCRTTRMSEQSKQQSLQQGYEFKTEEINEVKQNQRRSISDILPKLKAFNRTEDDLMNFLMEKLDKSSGNGTSIEKPESEFKKQEIKIETHLGDELREKEKTKEETEEDDVFNDSSYHTPRFDSLGNNDRIGQLADSILAVANAINRYCDIIQMNNCNKEGRT